MRELINILTEASIFTKPDLYSYGHKVNVAVGSEKGLMLLDRIKQVIPDFDEDEDLEWINNQGPVQSRQLPAVLLGRLKDFYPLGDSYRTFKRPNGEIFVIVGADSTIQACLTHASGEKGSTAENAGDASEPVLSAAVVAKLIKRGKDSVEDITADDVKKVFARALDDPGLTYRVTDQNSRVADNIRFTIMVKQPTRDFLSSPTFWEGKMGAILPSVVHYANSGQIDKYADYFYKNGKADMVSVISDGVSEAKDRKTDIEAYVKDKNGETRKLKGLNISLKAGSTNIGQVGGGQITNPNAKGYVTTNAHELFSPIGVDITAPRQINSKVEFWVHAYKQAAKQLKAMLKGKDAKKEAGVVYRIATFVSSHGTSGDPDIRLVSLGTKGISSVHSFKGIERKIAVEHIDLDCDYREGVAKTGDPRPELRIFDKTSGKPLLYIRYSSTQDESKVWNTIEMKDLLTELTTVAYTKQSIDVPNLTQVVDRPGKSANKISADFEQRVNTAAEGFAKKFRITDPSVIDQIKTDITSGILDGTPTNQINKTIIAKYKPTAASTDTAQQNAARLQRPSVKESVRARRT